jgi:hypothetical protein
MCGGDRSLSRPIDICQETSHKMPIVTKKDAKVTEYRYDAIVAFAFKVFFNLEAVVCGCRVVAGKDILFNYID